MTLLAQKLGDRLWWATPESAYHLRWEPTPLWHWRRWRGQAWRCRVPRINFFEDDDWIYATDVERVQMKLEGYL